MKILIWLEGGIVQSVLTDSNEKIDLRVMDFDADGIDDKNLTNIETREGGEYRVWIDEPYIIKPHKRNLDKERFNHYWNQVVKSKKKVKEKYKIQLPYKHKEK